MIEVTFNRGIYLPEMDLWLDPWEAKEIAFVSHAHSDHFARHGKVICSGLTADFLQARFGISEARLEAMEFGEMLERSGFRIRLLSAGHIAGSAMLHITRKADGSTLLYTGDFKVRRGRTTQPVNFLQADTLIMETTFGLPHLVFPGVLDVDMAVLRFVNDALADGETPVLYGYSLGKAQEAVALLAEHGIPVLSHPKVAEMSEVMRGAGITLPEPEVFEGYAPTGYAVIAPPNTVKSRLMRNIKNKRTAMLTGWALQPGSLYRYRVDQAIAMSDHADFTGLMECVTRVRPKRVLTIHGFAKEFAAHLRSKGLDAWCAMGGDQLELSLAKPTMSGSAVSGARQSRPVCELADFSDVCRLIGETNSRLSKIEFLVNYLRRMEGEDLEIVTRWLGGEAVGRRSGRRSLQLGSASIKRSILDLPGVKEERYREISLSQNDTARTTRIVMQEISSNPKPMKVSGLHDFFLNLYNSEQGLQRVELLSKQLLELHPVEAETLVRLVTGDLRIGLKEGLLEEAIADAFDANTEEVARVNMLTGDLGITAMMARENRLSEAQLTPMVPVRCMLAGALERDNDTKLPMFMNLSLQRPFWAEPKYDGIRAQLHKLGDDVGLYSRDMRPLEHEFPELMEAARSLKGDFVLDGELIAYAAGRKLGFADLQKRLGKKLVEDDLFSDSGLGSLPLKYVAFDLLWRNGEEMLGKELSERRRALEEIGLSGLFELIEVKIIEELEDLKDCFKRSLEAGHEGLILKDQSSVYSVGKRGGAWVKVKGVMPTLDCVVVAVEQGHGKRSDVLSDYTFALRDEVSGELRVLGKAYSGLKDEEIEELTEHFIRHTITKDRRKRIVEPNVVLEIEFDAIRRSSRHDSGMALRFPRIKAIRRDMGPEDVDTLRTAEGLLRE